MRLGFWNLGDGPGHTKWAGLTKLLAHGPDVIVVVEAADRHDLLSRWCAPRGWYLWQGDGRPGAASIAILVADPRAVLGRATYRGTRRTEVGAFGAGPDALKAKPLQVLAWRDQDGGDEASRVDVIGLHAPASTTRRVPVGTPGRRTKLRTLRLRRRLARRLFARVIEVLDHGVGDWPTLVVGDFNADPGSRLLRRFRRAGLVELVRRPTFKGKRYDQAWLHMGVGRLVAVVPMPGHDHDGFVVDVQGR